MLKKLNGGILNGRNFKCQLEFSVRKHAQYSPSGKWFGILYWAVIQLCLLINSYPLIDLYPVIGENTLASHPVTASFIFFIFREKFCRFQMGVKNPHRICSPQFGAIFWTSLTTICLFWRKRKLLNFNKIKDAEANWWVEEFEWVSNNFSNSKKLNPIMITRR